MSRCSTPLVTKPARAAYSNASLSVARSATPCRDLSVMTSCTRFLTVAKLMRAVDELAVGDEFVLTAAGCRHCVARCGHDYLDDFVDPRRDRRTGRTIGS